MTSVLRKAVIGLGVAGTLAVAAAVPATAQVVVVDPGYGYGGPRVSRQAVQSEVASRCFCS